jgi:septal ring factor EnvC (AmiA/AmiB activator)
MDRLSVSERYGLGYQQAEDRNDLKKYLRRVISDSQKKIKSLLKNPNKEITTFNSEDGPQRSTNRELANEHKDIKKRAVKDLNKINKQADTEKNFNKKMTRDKDTFEFRRKRIFTRTMKGRGGGGSMKMPQEYTRRSLLQKPL